MVQGLTAYWKSMRIHPGSHGSASMACWSTGWPTSCPASGPASCPASWPTICPASWPTSWPTICPASWPTSCPASWPFILLVGRDFVRFGHMFVRSDHEQEVRKREGSHRRAEEMKPLTSWSFLRKRPAVQPRRAPAPPWTTTNGGSRTRCTAAWTAWMTTCCPEQA